MISVDAKFKCRLCPVCNGRACAGELPGMGGVFEGKNHILNCAAWKEIRLALGEEKIKAAEARLDKMIADGKTLFRLAPVTGAEENIGWPDEDSFYRPFFEFVAAAKDILGVDGARCALSIGDGCPDNKLLSGIEAVRKMRQVSGMERTAENAGAKIACIKNARNGQNARAAVFLKPYPQENLFERIEWSRDVAEYLGVDTDAYNIVTMRNKVHLEKKSASQLKELRARAKVPFVIKGICTAEDIQLARETLPDAVVVSNHGGRVERPIGSSAEFLREHIAELKKFCGEVWVDGGIRTKEDALTAIALGADEILLGRPLITAFLKSVNLR